MPLQLLPVAFTCPSLQTSGYLLNTVRLQSFLLLPFLYLSSSSPNPSQLKLSRVFTFTRSISVNNLFVGFEEGNKKSLFLQKKMAICDQFPSGLRVLVVDDDTSCLIILEKMLLRLMYQGRFPIKVSSFFNN